MQHNQKPCRKKQSKNIKRKRTQNIQGQERHTLNNVVSLRISDQEKQELEKITKSTARNVSEVIREAIVFWMAKRKRLCLDA